MLYGPPSVKRYGRCFTNSTMSTIQFGAQFIRDFSTTHTHVHGPLTWFTYVQGTLLLQARQRLNNITSLRLEPLDKILKINPRIAQCLLVCTRARCVQCKKRGEPSATNLRRTEPTACTNSRRAIKWINEKNGRYRRYTNIK